MKYFIKIKQKEKGERYYYSSRATRLVVDNMILATKTVENIMLAADPRLETMCEIETYIEDEEQKEEEDEELQAAES